MGMKEGVKHWVGVALDTKDEIARELIDAGVDPGEALKASTVLTKSSVAEKLERHYGNRNAAQITSGISSHAKNNPLQ